METTEYSKEEISKYTRWKWAVKDIAGLQLYRFMAWVSRDPEVKKLYQEMKKAIYEEGNQPKALRIGEQIKSRLIVNAQTRWE